MKYDRTVRCLTRDRADLLVFHDFPAEHRQAHPDQQPDQEHQSHRSATKTTKTKDCLNRQTALALTHQLMLSAKNK